MQPTIEATTPPHEPDLHPSGHGHQDLGFWRTYIFSTDHKVIGIQYALTGMGFLFFGFVLVLLMRWQLAYPERAIPVLGELLRWMVGDEMIGRDPTGRVGQMLPDLYNSFGAMHGTVMVFLAVVPVGFAAFGNYVVPLQIGAPDMAFPRINMASYHSYFLGGVVMLASFFIPGGAAKSGWTSYSPLATVTGLPYLFDGQSFWLMGMVLLITSSLLGSVNFIVTIIQLRARGLTWMRLPFFVWSMFVTAFLLLLAFPPLEAAGIMQLMDNLLGTSFFLPTGLVISGQAMERSGGGSPLLWQHLFWFLGHPEVYVLILPAIGMVCEIIANNTRKPIWGYRPLVYSALAIGFLSFLVWAHHMYLTGMGTKVATFFQTTTIIISIPSVIILTCLFLSLWGGSIRINTPMLFALAFLPMFGIGGLTGLPLGFSYSDIQLHDTYYVIAHFHYVVAPGTIFAIFAGIYYWYPKVTGRFMSEFWGRVHFWLSLIFMNAVFLPMFAQGLGGLHRRMYDGGVTYAGAGDPSEGVVGVLQYFVDLNRFISHAAVMLFLAQIPFIINFFVSIKRGKPVESDNPWEATTLEWQTPTPPPHGNFTREIRVYRGPYEYSIPGEKQDYMPQNEPKPRPPMGKPAPQKR
jgi:cytochrome c oxidase subunit I